MLLYLGLLAQYSTYATVSIDGCYDNYVHENTTWKAFSITPKKLLDLYVISLSDLLPVLYILVLMCKQ